MNFSHTEEEQGDGTAILPSVSILRPSVLTSKVPQMLNVSPARLNEDSNSIGGDIKSSSTMPAPFVQEPIFKTTSSTSAAPAALTSTPGYVFGQNMFSRVVNAEQGASENLWQAVTVTSTSQANKEDNSLGDSVFMTLAKAVTKPSSDASSSSSPVAAEHLEVSADALARKRNAAQISLPSSLVDGKPSEITTGEEGERTVLDLACAAFVFNRDSKLWIPIGQSYLHLNDDVSVESSSRLIIRLQSTRRVVVNTRVWSEMPVANVVASKAVRIGAISADEGNLGSIKTYMLRFPSAQSAESLFDALEERKQLARKFEDTGVKRIRAEPSPKTQEDEANDVPTQSPQEKLSEQPSQTPEKISNGNPPTAATALSLVCRNFRRFDERGDVVEQVTTASIDLTDYSPDGPSILEVTSSSQSILTVSVGYRLAFCLVGDAAVQLFVVGRDDGGDDGENTGAEGEGRTKMSCRLELGSQAAADRLYRSLLLRVNRLFMHNSGMLNDPGQFLVTRLISALQVIHGVLNQQLVFLILDCSSEQTEKNASADS